MSAANDCLLVKSLADHLVTHPDVFLSGQKSLVRGKMIRQIKFSMSTKRNLRQFSTANNKEWAEEASVCL